MKPSVLLAAFTAQCAVTALACAQGDQLIIDTSRAIVVNIADFARLPDVAGGPARMMLLVDEPGTRRLFVNDMRGPIYSVSYDGRTVTPYVDADAAPWNVQVQSSGRERGIQSFAFHPQFAQAGTPGYGRFYTWSDVRDTNVPVDYKPGGGSASHHTALHEWRAKNPAAATYDGDAPRLLLRIEQPFSNHNGGMVTFNPLARPGQPDFGLLYVGVADGGSGGDPLNLAQNPASIFGKILRIDPLGTNSANGKYGIPADNPWVQNGPSGGLREVFAYGVRNPQRFGWDPANGNMFMSDIGQNAVEKISLVKPGANLGWNVWEGSYPFRSSGGGSTRSDPKVLYPVVEYSHSDPLMLGNVAVTGVIAYRGGPVTALRNQVLFADFPSGEMFAFDADRLPQGGTAFRRILFGGSAQPRKFLRVLQDAAGSTGRSPASRADLRFGTGPANRVFLLNKADGVVREIVP